MKKLLLFITIITFVSCSSDDNSKIKNDPLYGTNKGGVYVSTFYSKKIASGEKFEEKYSGCLIHIWDAENRDFDVKNSRDVITGYLFDNNSKTSIEPIITSLNKHSFFETLKEGKYFVYINTTDPGSTYLGTIPRFGYSYTYFEVKYKEDTKLKKVFDISKGQGTVGVYYPWE